MFLHVRETFKIPCTGDNFFLLKRLQIDHHDILQVKQKLIHQGSKIFPSTQATKRVIMSKFKTCILVKSGLDPSLLP